MDTCNGEHCGFNCAVQVDKIACHSCPCFCDDRPYFSIKATEKYNSNVLSYSASYCALNCALQVDKIAYHCSGKNKHVRYVGESYMVYSH